MKVSIWRLKRAATVIAAAMALLASGKAVAAQQQQPAPPVLTAEQWRQDLDFMVAELEQRHLNLYHSVDRARFQSEVQRLRERIPSLQRNEIIVGMMRVAALVGDGHTRVDPRKDTRFSFPSLPLRLFLFDDGLYVRAAAPAYADLVGARIEAIGGVPVEQAIARVSGLASRHNDIGPLLFVPLYLNMPDILHALQLSKTRDAAELRLRRGGKVWTAKVTGTEPTPLWPPDTDISLTTPDGWADAATAARSLWLQAPLDYHRLVPLPERGALYVQLNMVTGVEGQTLSAFSGKIAEAATVSNPRAVILDLRLNLGGNGALRHDLVRQLIKLEDADTRLFVLTARGTFSASQFILDDLDRLSDAVFIGEPASSRPTSYGDSYRMPMPNSGISIRTSIAYWQDEQNRAPWTFIDVAAPYKFSDYASGRDPALEAALSYVPPAPLAERLKQSFAKGGRAGIDEAVKAYRAAPVNRYANVELHLIRAAQGLARTDREAALGVAEATAAAFPGSADASLILALMADAAGKREAAIAAARRTMEIDRNSRPARSLVEKLTTASN